MAHEEFTETICAWMSLSHITNMSKAKVYNSSGILHIAEMKHKKQKKQKKQNKTNINERRASDGFIGKRCQMPSYKRCRTLFFLLFFTKQDKYISLDWHHDDITAVGILNVIRILT